MIYECWAALPDHSAGMNGIGRPQHYTLPIYYPVMLLVPEQGC